MIERERERERERESVRDREIEREREIECVCENYYFLLNVDEKCRKKDFSISIIQMDLND